MGLFKRFGSFASRIWETIKTSVQPIADAIGIGRQAGVELEPYDLVSEYRRALMLDPLESAIANVGLEQTIPHSLYLASVMPWKRRFAYTVQMSGRDLLTGKFAYTYRTLTFSREMEVGEIMEAADNYFSSTGEYKQFDISHMSVVQADYREGDFPW